MKGLIKSFGYAARGILTCILQERNMRVHLVCCLYMYSFLLIYNFFEVSRTQFALIFLATAGVLMGELMNTAVEAAINLIEEKFNEKYNRLAKVAKDTAAGGVLVFAIFAVAVGISILWQKDAFIKMFNYYCENIPMLIVLILSLILSFAFIFAGPQKLLNLFKKKKDK